MKVIFAIMGNNIRDTEIEKTLNDFDESDISDLKESKKSDLLLDLYDAFEGKSYFAKALTKLVSEILR